MSVLQKGNFPIALVIKNGTECMLLHYLLLNGKPQKEQLDMHYLWQKHRKIYIGGIAATLMKDSFVKEFPGIPESHIVKGLLNENGKLGYDDDGQIDTITPDYSILDDIRDQHVYPTENAYFMYTTRGCGMKCEFCAVQQLEPYYIPRIRITDQVNNIIAKYLDS